MSPFDGDSNTIGIQYCPGYVDKNGSWRAGFYCPPKSQGRKMYCCGSTIHKYCCGSKEENEFFGGSSISYISSSTMFTVTIVTFIFAVMLTVLGFVCCRKFFKRHLGGLDMSENHPYHINTGVDGQSIDGGQPGLLPCPVNGVNGGLPNNTTTTTTTINLFDLTDGSPYTNLLSPSSTNLPPPPHLINSTSNRLMDSYIPTISSYINPPPTVGFIDPPPPYQVSQNYHYNDLNNNDNNSNDTNQGSINNQSLITSVNSGTHVSSFINQLNPNNQTINNVDRTNNQNRILSMLGGSYRRDIIHPCEGQKRLWRTMSQ
ncbi:protein shisa-1-like [Panonychus citri]|uniref:protein shisa-1-like n=1 Tax=Panonychus citri TaxID=50023 RepID=UPI002306E98F|nr:protein shisa-1-like [Panonychus citri]